MGSQIEILPEMGGIQKFIWNVAGRDFPSRFRVEWQPLRQESNPGHNNSASYVIFRTGVIFLRRQARSQRRARDTPDGGERGGGVRVGVEKIRRSFKFLSDARQPEGDEIAALFA